MKPHNYNQSNFDANMLDIDARQISLIDKTINKQAASGMDRILTMSKDVLGYKNVILLEKSTLLSEAELIEIKEEMYREVYLILQMGTNLWNLSFTQRPQLSVVVDDNLVEFKSISSKDYVSSKNWIYLCRIGQIAREQNAIDCLKSIPMEFIKDSDDQVDIFYYALIDFYKSIGTDEMLQNLDIVFEELNGPHLASKEYINNIILPELNCWRAIIQRDEMELNQKISDAVKCFSNHYSEEISDYGGDSYRYNDPSGYLAVQLTALASYSFDQGMKINCVSDYLPRFFVEGMYDVDAKVVLP